MKMKTLLSLLLLLFFFQAQSLGQTYRLPAGARVIETRAIQSKAHPNRALVMWMINPKRNPRETPNEPYTCPEETRGHYWNGPLRVSLVDTRTRRVINTLMIIPDYYDDEDSFDIPYKIHNGYYTVTGLRRGQKEGVPVLMRLRDYNADGRAHEFALFDALACMGLLTTLIGYSESKDMVIQYPVNVDAYIGENRSRKVLYWPDYLFTQKPLRPGYWKYEIDYRGRGGSLDKWEIRYNPRLEAFEGRVTHVPGD